MAFIDHVRELSGKIEKEKEDFLTRIRLKIEEYAKYGNKEVGFWVGDLVSHATYAKGLIDHDASADDTFQLFGYAVEQLRSQGFVIEAEVRGSTVAFIIKW